MRRFCVFLLVLLTLFCRTNSMQQHPCVTSTVKPTPVSTTTPSPTPKPTPKPTKTPKPEYHQRTNGTTSKSQTSAYKTRFKERLTALKNLAATVFALIFIPPSMWFAAIMFCNLIYLPIAYLLDFLKVRYPDSIIEKIIPIVASGIGIYGAIKFVPFLIQEICKYWQILTS